MKTSTSSLIKITYSNFSHMQIAHKMYAIYSQIKIELSQIILKTRNFQCFTHSEFEDAVS